LKRDTELKRYIVLLRGINVGGNNLLPMKALTPLLAAAGFANISTILQTGNIILDSEGDPAARIVALITQQFGFSPATMCLSGEEFKRVAQQNPYPDFEGKFVHFYFCQQAPSLDKEGLAALAKESESYQLIGNVFHLHAPEGIGRSKLVANIDKCLGVAGTGRNANTVNKIIALLARDS